MRRARVRLLLSVLLLVLLLLLLSPLLTSGLSSSRSSNSWAVIVSTSRYWFNYRHTANALSLYRIVKRAGIPDSRILLMLPEDYACQSRNGAHAAAVFNSAQRDVNLYSEDDVEVDYRGAAVSVESFLRLLRGRHASDVSKSQRLLSDSGSSVLLYLSGHGGDEFLKFQDQEELSAVDLALAVEEMSIQSRFSRLLLIADTCQAETLSARIRTPGVISIAASRLGQNSYSHHTDSDVGLAVIDRFTFHILSFFEREQAAAQSSGWLSRASLQDLFASLSPSLLLSTPAAAVVGSSQPEAVLRDTPLSAFFAADQGVQTTNAAYHRNSSRLQRSAPPAEVTRAQQLPVVAWLAPLAVAVDGARQAEAAATPAGLTALTPLLLLLLLLAVSRMDRRSGG